MLKAPLKIPARKADRSLRKVRSHMAEHMIGNAVELLDGSEAILFGVVTGVATEAGMPKIVVNGRRYDINQVLTILPATLV